MLKAVLIEGNAAMQMDSSDIHSIIYVRCSVEETEDFATDMLCTSLVVVHDALVGCEDEDTELTRGKHGVGEVFELAEGEIETGWDDTAFVEATVEVDNNLATAGVINDLKLVDVAMLLHNLEELDKDLGCGPKNHLYHSIINC